MTLEKLKIKFDDEALKMVKQNGFALQYIKPNIFNYD